MPLTDQHVLAEIQYHLLEPADDGATWPSGLWSVAELTAALNQRQIRFLQETGVVLSRSTVNTIPNTHTHDLPSDWLVTRRVAWQGLDGTYRELPPADGWSADHADRTWQYNTAVRPRIYMETDTPTVRIRLAPAAFDGGLLHILYVAVPTALSNTGVAWTAPDECVAGIKWGVLADLLLKDGPAYDPDRAGYCEQRFAEAVEATQWLLRGWA